VRVAPRATRPITVKPKRTYSGGSGIHESVQAAQVSSVARYSQPRSVNVRAVCAITCAVGVKYGSW